MDSLIDNRIIRVFISSTFQDMQAERDYLMTAVFPFLRKKAAERDVTLIELDLRWGITEKEAQSGKVVQICLNEIDNSHPFFIGLLGNRYGWCPPMQLLEQDTTLAERYPWIKEDLSNGISVTEIEMQYGVLRRKDPRLNACFFIKRDSDSIEPKQQTLKQLVRSNELYPHFDYSTPEELGEKVKQVFSELLDRLFPQKELSALELERLLQRAFMRSRCHVYIRNEANFKFLNSFIDSESQYLVVSGESGMGKSALIANWLADHSMDERYEVIYHFVGHSGAEGDYTRILLRLIDEIHDLYGIPKKEGMFGELGQKEPKEILENLLIRISDKKPLLIVLDGINLLADKERSNPKYLNWLPYMPVGCKMLFSTLEEDETMETFRRRNYPVFHLLPLDQNQRKEMIRDYLSSYGKTLTSAQVNRIANDSETRNTLVLRTLLDELICFGIYEQLDARIDYYLMAENIEDFFQRVLKRAEEDYGADVVRDTLSFIALSYDGMTEKELIEISGITPLRWSAFYCAFTSHLIVMKGLINFSHRYLREAVIARYIDSSSDFCYRHRLIEYFTPAGNDSSQEGGTDDVRSWSELAHQYYHMRMNDEMYSLVLRSDVFEWFYRNCTERLASIWQQLKADPSGKYSLNDYFTNSFSKLELFHFLLLAAFIDTYFKEFEVEINVLQHSLGILRKLRQEYITDIKAYKSILSNILYHLGVIHFDLQDYAVAEKEYKEALELLRQLMEEFPSEYDSRLAATLNGLGNLHSVINRPYLAESELLESLSIRTGLVCLSQGYEAHLADSHYNLGILYDKLQKYDFAEEHYYQALDIYRHMSMKYPGEFDERIAGVLNSLGVMYKGRYDYTRSLNVYQEALKIWRTLVSRYPDVYDPSLANTLNNIGSLHTVCQDYESAERELVECLDIRRRLASRCPEAYEADLAESLRTLGVLYGALDKYDLDEKVHLESLEIQRKLTQKCPERYGIGLGKALHNIAHVYSRRKLFDRAEKYYKEAIAIYQSLSADAPDSVEEYLGYSLNDLAVMHVDMKQYGEAKKEYGEALDINRRLALINPEKFDPKVAMTAFNLAGLYKECLEYDSAEKLYNEALTLYRRLSERHPETFNFSVAKLLYCIGDLHNIQNNYELAEKEFTESLDIACQLPKMDMEMHDVQVGASLQELAILHFNRNNYSLAESEYTVL